MAAKYFALCQKLKLFLVDLRFKTLKNNENGLIKTNTLECKGYEEDNNVII